MEPKPIHYKKGDKVVIFDISGPLQKYCEVGDILTIKKKVNDDFNTYYTEEHPCCIKATRFKPYHPSQDSEEGGYYNGWPNQETDEAATVFFNDKSRLDQVYENLVGLSHIKIRSAANWVLNIGPELSFGDPNNICVFSILRQYAVDHLGNKEINSQQYHAIIADLTVFYPRKQPSLQNQAQAIADHIQRAAESFQAVADGLKPKQEKTIMKVETKHFVNDTDITEMTIEEKVALIKKTEDKITELSAVKTKSTMVQKEITKLETFLGKAVKLFDAEEL